MNSSNRLKLKQLGSLRIFIVTQDGADRSGRKVGAGSVIIFRKGRAIPEVFENVYDALRSRTEIICRYGFGEGGAPAGELRQLAETRERLQRTWSRLAAGEGAAGGSAAKNIGRVARDLKHKSDPDKSEARTKAKAGPVRTARNGRLNQMATQARVASMDGLLASREETVSRILPWIKAQESALRLEVDRCFRIVERLTREVGFMLSGHEFFARGRTTPNQLKGIAARLRLLKQETDTLIAEPFRSFRDLADGCLDQAVPAVEGDDVRLAERHLDKLLTATDRVLLRRGIEALITSISEAIVAGSGQVSLARIRRQAAELAELCGDLEMGRSYASIAPAFRHGCELLRACGRSGNGGPAETILEQLEVAKQSFKDISRRLSQ